MLGKWVLLDEGDHYHTGQIVWVKQEYVLIKVDTLSEVPSHMRLFPIERLTSTFSAVFDTQAELDAFLEWMDGGAERKLRVVPIGTKGSE